MFKSINREINQIINRGFDRTLRLAVTGLSRSGKTAFITSLINQLLHINQEGNAHLPLFEAARNQSILAVKRVPQQDLSIPRFDYEANLNDLMNNPPQWCQSTLGVSETRLAIRFERQSGLLRHFKERGTLYLDIFDYPGEWLLDLPLLNLDFQQWSLEQAKITSGVRQQFAQDWLDKLKKLDLSAVVNEDVLAQIAKSYTDYLLACKAEGMQFIQEQWQKLKREAKSNSYFAVLNKRYDYYRNKVVKGFYENYFSTFDRQVILADCLTPLNHSQQAFIDMQTGLNQLFKNFHYGKRYLLNRLFSPNIDKLMFVATKADHITTDQIQNLISLMRQLVQEGGRHVEFEGIDTEYTAIAAIRATKQVLVNQNGKQIRAIQGVRSLDKQLITLYPGSVPSKLPSAEFWSKQSFDFDSFEPQVLQQGESIPHLRMDAVLQFLLADRFD